MADIRPVDGIGCRIAATTRAGFFRWTDGDFTAEHAADPDEYDYVKGDGIDVNSGIWVRLKITALQLGDNAVTTTKISANAVTGSKIASGAVSTAKIADEAVTTQKLADNSVTRAKASSDIVTQAANITELRALTGLNVDGQILDLAGRDAVGDGGGSPNLYVDLSDTTTPDDGVTTFEAGGGVRIKRPNTGEISARFFGAYGKDGPEYTQAFEDIIQYANDNGSTGSSGKEKTGLTVKIPDGVYYIPNGLVGSSPDACIFVVETGELFRWGAGLGAGRAHGGGLRNIKIWAVSADAMQTCIALYKTAHMRFEGIRLRDVGSFAKLGDAAAGDFTSSAHFADVMGWCRNLGVPTFDLQEGAGLKLSESYIYTNIGTPSGTDPHAALAGQDFIRCAGNWDTVNVENVNCNRYYRSIDCAPSAGNNANNWFVTNFYGDYSAHGARWNSDGSNIRTHKYHSCWFWATDGHSVEVSGGATGLLDDVHFHDVSALLSGADGFNISKGNGVEIVSCTTQGQGRLVAGSSGVLLGDIDNVTVRGGRHGLDASTVTPFAAQADYGVKTTTDATRYTLKDVRATGAVAGYDISDPASQPGSCSISGNFKTDGGQPEYRTAGTITVPASGAAYANTSPFRKRYMMSGGSGVTNVRKNGGRISTDTNCSFELDPGENFDVTYTTVPQVREEVVN
jgi:hypothetical protein